MDILQETNSQIDRRQFLRIGGLAGVSLISMGLLAGCGGNASGLNVGGGVTDADILNFALNLEYLEAEYYQLGVFGTGLSAADKGNSTAGVTGGRQVTFTTTSYQEFAQEVAEDELAHVRYLRSALGSAAVAEPMINFTAAFNAAAVAAGIGATFDPFADEVSFLIGAFVFEDVGVTAYHGGAPLISSKDYLSAAAGILGTEAYHAGTIRSTLYGIGGAATDAAQKISDLRASVGGGKDQGILVGGKANIVPTDVNGLTFARTTTEVLNIVYLNGTKTPGGFFPNGLNGTIR